MSSTVPVSVIKSKRGFSAINLNELWHYRELLFFLTLRDVKVRYKQTVLGAAWAIIQPVLTMVVFSVFFGRLAKIPSEGVPYPIFSYSALLPWTLFSQGLSQSANSLVGNANLLTKVYFPRIIIPVSSVLSPLVDFAIAFLVLVGLMIYYKVYPTITVLWLPVLLLYTVATTLGISLWFSALNVQYRDIRYAVPFLVQLWLFVTPVIYPINILNKTWRVILGLNPITGVIEGFRWALLGTARAEGIVFWLSTAMAFVIFATGALYFSRMERTFADVV